MVTRRDLVEASSSSRRRLVTAFVSGAPDGREVTPARPGRTIIGGLALALLLLAGAAVSGVLADRDSDTSTHDERRRPARSAPFGVAEDQGFRPQAEFHVVASRETAVPAVRGRSAAAV